ncbi:MAG: SDR family NAD(P)-dependent oxidoreductase [Paracoccaceae bacterium]|nr:SDR family NAD(P)-dependent oxidoreductase [Paracoccaceae bacterium]
MRTWTGKKYWLVGASEGLGQAVAEVMSRAGTELVLSARSQDRLEEVAAALPGKATAVAMDIADTESVEAAVGEVGPVDGIVCLASVYWPQPATALDPGQVEAMCDINFTGMARVLSRVLPGMVERDAGHVVITGSLSGYRGLPGSIGYAASKAGTMVLAEGLHCDLRRTGVDVQLINPGYIRTRQTDKNAFTMPFIMEPEEAARRFFDHMNSDKFQKSFPGLFSLLFRGGNFLPDWLYYRIWG